MIPCVVCRTVPAGGPTPHCSCRRLWADDSVVQFSPHREGASDAMIARREPFILFWRFWSGGTLERVDWRPGEFRTVTVRDDAWPEISDLTPGLVAADVMGS